MTTIDVLIEFVEAQRSRGYVPPHGLSQIERCPSEDDDGKDITEESTCPVDRYLLKRKGLR